MRVSCKSLNPTISDSPICDRSCMTFASLNGPQPTRATHHESRQRFPPSKFGPPRPPQPRLATTPANARSHHPRRCNSPGERLHVLRCRALACTANPTSQLVYSRDRAFWPGADETAASSQSGFYHVLLAGCAGGAQHGLSRATDHSSEVAARPVGASMAAGRPVVPCAGSLLERQIFRSGFMADGQMALRVTFMRGFVSENATDVRVALRVMLLDCYCDYPKICMIGSFINRRDSP